MRAFVVFLLSTVCICANAQAQQPSPSAPANVVTEPQLHTFALSSPDSKDNSKDQQNNVRSQLPGLTPQTPKARTHVIPRKWAFYTLDGPTCFTMRSYIVKRESPNSDVTVPAGYVECTPGTRVKIKNAVPQETVPEKTEMDAK